MCGITCGCKTAHSQCSSGIALTKELNHTLSQHSQVVGLGWLGDRARRSLLLHDAGGVIRISNARGVDAYLVPAKTRRKHTVAE